WISYLGDIEMLRISFLKEDEAIQLITQPTPDFQGKQIFNEAVAEKVVYETTCHPFLLQAVCAKLIDYLKIEQIQCIDTNVVEKIIEQSLNEGSSIHEYFSYLWRESDD